MKRIAYEDCSGVLNAEQIAMLLRISRSGAYQLLNRADVPTLHIGKRKLAPKDKVLAWIDRQIGEWAELETRKNRTFLPAKPCGKSQNSGR